MPTNSFRPASQRPQPPEPPAESSRPSNSTSPDDRLKEIQAAVEASPSKIAVIFVRGHQVPGPSMNASKLAPFAPGHPSWDHVAVAWMDANGKLVFGEARPDNGAKGAATAGKISPGTARELVTDYKDFKVLPIDLSRYGPGARDYFVNAVSEALKGLYSLHQGLGNVCSTVIGFAFEAAARKGQTSEWFFKLKSIAEKVLFGGIIGFLTDLIPTYTPADAYLEARKHSVPGYRFDPAKPLVKREWLVVGKPSAVVASVSDEASASLLEAIGSASLLGPIGGEEQASPFGQPAPESDTDAAQTDDAAQQPATEGQGASHSDHVHIVDTENVNTNDAASQESVTDGEGGSHPEQVADTPSYGDEGASYPEQVPDTASDGDEGASHPEQVAVAPDTDEEASHSEQVVAPDTTTEGEHSEQVAAASDTPTDGNEGVSHSEQVAFASNSFNYAAVMETAKAEVESNLTQAEPPAQLATSAPFSADDSLLFSMFAGAPAELAKQEMPAEFAKQGMPAEQLSPEAISSAGTPGSESAHSDLDSAEAGNAAPSKDPVVHHAELAP